MSKKIAVITVVVVMSMGLMGCHSYDYRYSDGVGYDMEVYDDGEYDDYGWAPYPSYSLSYYGSRGDHRYNHHEHHRDDRRRHR
jgi:hypothetical protein